MAVPSRRGPRAVDAHEICFQVAGEPGHGGAELGSTLVRAAVP